MSREEMLKWMDDMIEERDRLIRIDQEKEEQGFCVCTVEPAVHLYKSIEKISEIVGIPVLKQKHSEEYERLYFRYKKHEFFELKRVE